MVFFISAIATLLITGVAGYVGKLKINNSKDFIVGGNELGITGVTGALMGSIIGGASTVGTAQMAYNRGVGAIWFILGICISSILLGLIYSKHADSKKIDTIPQIIGNTYGKKARISASTFLSLGMFIHINGQVIAVIALFTSVFSINPSISAYIIVALLMFYVVFGGFWGSTFVGIIKTILLYSTSLICGYILIFKFNGINEITSHFTYNPWFNLFSRGLFEDLASGLATITGVLSTQTYFQAIMSGKNSKTSKYSAFITAFLVLPVGIVCTLIGMYMRIHYPNIMAREAFPLFLINHLNPVLSGVSIATVLISSMATAAGLSLGIATMFVKDFYTNIINISADDNRQIFVSRISILTIGVITLVVVLNNQSSMILDWGFLSMVFRATPIFVPLIASLFFKNNINTKTGIYAVIGGPTLSILWIICGFGKISSLYIGLIIGIIILFVFNKNERAV